MDLGKGRLLQVKIINKFLEISSTDIFHFRLGHGTDQHVRKPTMIEALRDKKIIHVAVGALHCLAVTENGQV